MSGATTVPEIPTRERLADAVPDRRSGHGHEEARIR
jgi:hypothetical protein